jgi:SRSO17 transposase
MPLLVPSPCPESSSQEAWTQSFNTLSQRIRHCFTRQASYHRACAYVQGLLSEASRKNVWQVAEEVGEAPPYAMQRLLDRATWEGDGVRDALPAAVSEVLATSNAVLVIDETGFLKQRAKPV